MDEVRLDTKRLATHGAGIGLLAGVDALVCNEMRLSKVHLATDEASVALLTSVHAAVYIEV